VVHVWRRQERRNSQTMSLTAWRDTNVASIQVRLLAANHCDDREEELRVSGLPRADPVSERARTACSPWSLDQPAQTFPSESNVTERSLESVQVVVLPERHLVSVPVSFSCQRSSRRPASSPVTGTTRVSVAHPSLGPPKFQVLPPTRTEVPACCG
jgi:hypothetical protein